jgi:uncharacterized protein (TIGR01777 family)
MPLNVVIAGASGFLGSHLSDEMRRRGHAVTALVRRPTAGAGESTWDPYAGTLDRDVIERADVVVNLAATPTVGNPYSRKRIAGMRESRVTTTRVLAEAIAGSERKPSFLAGNAVGYYGDHGDEVITEESDSRGDSPLTAMSRDWEAASDPARDAGARVCRLRTAPVMDRTSPPLKQMRLAFKAGLGTRMGNGRQYFPMVSLRDWLAAAAFLAEHESASGPFNICCPTTPTNAEFTDALARAVHRKAFLVVPGPVLKVAAGQMAPELLGSLNIRPVAIEALGYRFEDRHVDDVLVAARA